MRAFLVSLAAGMGLLLAIPGISAQRAVNERFAGVWKLVAEETRDPNGQIVPGPNAASGGRFGYITYDPAGYVGVTIAWSKRPAFRGKASTPDEARAAMTSYNSYWGSFAVNEARGTVTHQTFGAVSPPFAGTDQVRGFTIAGNRLTLRPPNLANGDQRTLTWERVPDLPTLTPTHRKLIGFWKLISLERRTAKGEMSSTNPGMTGFLVYTASGHVMVHMMDPYRRRRAGETSAADGTMATYRSDASYVGQDTVNEGGGYVVHHLAAGFNARVDGTDFPRCLEFAGRRLVLKPPGTKDGTDH